DEIQTNILDAISEHIKNNHGGKPDNTCQFENEGRKLLFYIKQEIDTLPVVAHQRKIPNQSHIRTKVFVSYSQIDKEYLVDLKPHFKPFLNHIDFWDD